MAQELDDGEFWLPSEFLTDDDLLTDFKRKGGGDFSWGSVNPFGFGSDLSSPVESVTGSTETESDEDDFLAFLTRKMTYSTLNDSNVASDYSAKGWKMSGSPQSTLCGYKPGSSRSSPKSVSQVSSPPCSKDAVSWDLLYAAAEEVARLRVNEAAAALYQAKFTSRPSKPSSATGPRPNGCTAIGIYPNHKTQPQLSYQNTQATQFQQLKSEIWGQGKIGNQFQNRSIRGVEETNGLSAAAWPTLIPSQQQRQQLSSSGMRAVFLAENGAKKERTGTGVFLPRGYGANSTETRRKPAGSTVLLPDRVVHSLKLNLDSIDASPQAKSRCNTNLPSPYDAGLKNRNNVMMDPQMRNIISQPVLNQELRLPQEWSY